MKKFLCTIAGLVFCFTLVAQDFWRENHIIRRTVNSEEGYSPLRMIGIEGGLYFGTDGLNNQFLSNLYTGGFLDSTYIEDAAAQLLPVNRFGFHSSVGIVYSFELKDSVKSLITFSLLKRSNISGKFSDDAFRLGFQGNTRYKGLEADISGTRFTHMSWTQAKIGFSTRETDNTYISVAVSLLAGNQYNEANINYGKLFTDSQGLFINGSVGGDYYSSDTANTSALAINGFGTAVDVTWLFTRSLKSGSEYYRIEFLDFGFINWNNKTIHRYADTTFHYEGADISQIFASTDYVTDLPTEDDFIKSDTSVVNRSTFLPAVIRGTYLRYMMNNKLRLKAQFAVPVWSYALPYGAITAGYSFWKSKITVTSGIAYGGYSKTQVPFHLDFTVLPNTTLQLGSTNVLVFVKPDVFSGNGVFVKLSHCL